MNHAIVSREEWIAARKALLLKEKKLTAAFDQLNEERRKLPVGEDRQGVRVRHAARPAHAS